MHDEDDLDHVHRERGEPRYFHTAVNVFLVDDVVETALYYRDVLGFEIEFIYGDPPAYASVVRDEAILNFAISEPPGRRNSVNAVTTGNGVDCLIMVNDVDDIFAELTHKGARVHGQPEDQSYGYREFHFEDLNGYKIALAQELETDDSESDDV